MIFLPRHDKDAQAHGCLLIEKALQEYGIPLLGWRSVPLHLSALGTKALETLPDIQQVLIGRPDHLTGDAFEQRLYLICKELEHRVMAAGFDEFHIASFSHRTIVYKGC